MQSETYLWTNEPFEIVLGRFLNDNEWGVLAQQLHTLYPSISFDNLILSLKKKIAGTGSVNEFQGKVAECLDELLSHTTSGFDVEGLENIEIQADAAKQNGQGFLFIANHRDIVLDAALMNYALYRYLGLETAHIAFGHNFLDYPLLADFFTLNKGFPITRGLNGRKLQEESKRVSAYISERIESGQSVWIAQRDGRSKDGNDETLPSVVKMLHLSHRPKSVEEWVNASFIIPVTVAYEWLPTDLLFAYELYCRARDGDYTKQKGEDMKSFIAGLKGFKGRVKLVFGQRLQGEFPTIASVKQELDSQIQGNYELWPSNWIAHDYPILSEAIGAQAPVRIEGKYEEADADFFSRRVMGCPPHIRELVRLMYARPVANKQKYQNI